jgi:hypothetical protein
MCKVKDLAACLNAKDDDGHHQDIKHHTLASSLHNGLIVVVSFGNGPYFL